MFQEAKHTHTEYRNGDLDPLTWVGRTDESIPYKPRDSFRGNIHQDSFKHVIFLGKEDKNDSAHQSGPFWHPFPLGYTGSIRHDLAIPPRFNTLDYSKVLTVPPGLRVYRGIAAPLGDLPGGGTQIWIPEPVLKPLLKASTRFLAQPITSITYKTFITDCKETLEIQNQWLNQYDTYKARVHHESMLSNIERLVESIRKEMKCTQWGRADQQTKAEFANILSDQYNRRCRFIKDLSKHITYLERKALDAAHLIALKNEVDSDLGYLSFAYLITMTFQPEIESFVTDDTPKWLKPILRGHGIKRQQQSDGKRKDGRYLCGTRCGQSTYATVRFLRSETHISGNKTTFIDFYEIELEVV